MKRLTELNQAALQASLNSYSPYSHFPVGAAVLTQDGQIVLGTNVENASFGLTNCAERSAIFSAVSQGLKPVSIALVCPKGSPEKPATLMPCGACLQVLLEHLGPEGDVSIVNLGVYQVKHFLPYAFSLTD